MHEQAFTWDGIDLKEVGYGWRDLSVLMASVNAMPTSVQYTEIFAKQFDFCCSFILFSPLEIKP
jgi:hypothetical protein